MTTLRTTLPLLFAAAQLDRDKGGIAIAIAHELGLPIKLIGIGESLEDLRPFEADAFARALFSE